MAIASIVLLLVASAQLLIVQGEGTNYEWVSYNPATERLPQNAITAAYDIEGNPIYITQMRIGRDKIPAQLIPGQAVSYAVSKGDIYKSPLTAIPTPILCGSNYHWEFASFSTFPKNAISCGKSEAGETLYVGRAEFNGTVVVGSAAKSGALFAAFNGAEVEWFGTYKVLVSNEVDSWTRTTFEDFPEDAVVGGFDKSKNNLYVGIIRVGAQVVPAQINPEAQTAVASYAGGIAKSDDFQVLTGNNYKWSAVKKGNMPSNVVIAGRTEEGEAMYVGRVIYKKIMTMGTVLASENILYISYQGKVRTVEAGYEVLVRVKGNQ